MDPPQAPNPLPQPLCDLFHPLSSQPIHGIGSVGVDPREHEEDRVEHGEKGEDNGE